MALLTRTLCRVWKCAPPRPGKEEGADEKAEPSRRREVSPDDLTAIGGIGMATQNRLYAAGIKTYAELARTSSEDVREILGKLARGTKVEDWIRQAEKLTKEE